MNVFIKNWHWTGQNVPVPQAEVDITLEWIDDAGQPHTWTGSPKFPNILAQLPQKWVKEALEELVLRAARYKFGDGQ